MVMVGGKISQTYQTPRCHAGFAYNEGHEHFNGRNGDPSL